MQTSQAPMQFPQNMQLIPIMKLGPSYPQGQYPQYPPTLPSFSPINDLRRRMIPPLSSTPAQTISQQSYGQPS